MVALQGTKHLVMKQLLSFLSLLLIFSAPLLGQDVVISNVNIVDVEKGKILSNKTIEVKDGKVVNISSKKVSAASSAIFIDGTGKYAMPGLIDTHIHFFQSGDLYTRPDAIDLRAIVPYEDEMAFAEKIIPDNFKRYLRLGITTLMDVGGPMSNFRVRDSIAKKNLSPNVFVTGPLFSPYQPAALAELADKPIELITNIEEATALFNKMLPSKPDFIKIWYIASNEIPAEKTFPIVQHIANLAHQNNLKLAVHATQLNTATLAVKAGADILVHSVDDVLVTEEFAKLLKDNKVTYIPTLIVSKNYYKSFLGKPNDHPQDLAYGNPMVYRSLTDMKKYSDEDAPKAIGQYRKQETGIVAYYAKVDTVMWKNLKFLNDYGVNIATGTDAGNIGTVHASSYLQEMEVMLKAGLSVPEILKASTINAAKGFGLEKEVGSISEGKKADILILNANPLSDLANTNAIRTVIKSGVVLEASTILHETPEQVVQRQVNAYNARNIDAFMDTYSEDITIYNFPEVESLKGKVEMRKAFDKMFQEVPNLYCEIKNRIVLGNKVVDREYVRFGENYSSVIAIYEVNDGKISKVTFLR